MPLWFSNLMFWSAQVALLVLVAELLPRLFRIRQPQVLLGYWRALLLLTLALPFVQPWHRLPSATSVAIVSNSAITHFPTASLPAVSRLHFPSVDVVAKAVAITILGGIVLRFVLFTVGLLRLRRFRQASTPVTDSHALAAILDRMLATVGAGAEWEPGSPDSAEPAEGEVCATTIEA